MPKKRGKGRKQEEINQKLTQGERNNVDLKLSNTNSQKPIKEKNIILNTIHPFEKAGLTEGKCLSPLQKALTCVMESNGGFADEETILTFLQQNWTLINNNSSHHFVGDPSPRLIHINFSIKKSGLPLFIQHPTKPHCWGCNKLENIQNHGTIIDAERSFENSLETYLKSSNTHSFSEIINEAKKFKNQNGLFQSLDFERRVRAILIVFKNQGKVTVDENNVWKYGPKESEKKEITIKPPKYDQYSVNEIWEKLYKYSA